MPETYRACFTSHDKASGYDAQQYASQSHVSIMWHIEQAQLTQLLQQFRQSHPRIDYLDFAAGTGRIISFMEEKVDAATGIEISQSMLDVARTKVKKVRLICADITVPGTPVEGKYDLITAFRFMLNAEPSLRVAALKALAARLKGKNSCLVFNNHGYLFSHKLFLWPWHILRRLGKGWQPQGNYMTHRQAHELCRQAGLKIESAIGSGVLSLKMLKLLPVENALRLEEQLTGSRVLAKFGVNQMYVARLV
ncbi:MAG: class I SAM-dependent methyltransferase [Planctomycetota bacterium]